MDCICRKCSSLMYEGKMTHGSVRYGTSTVVLSSLSECVVATECGSAEQLKGRRLPAMTRPCSATRRCVPVVRGAWDGGRGSRVRPVLGVALRGVSAPVRVRYVSWCSCGVSVRYFAHLPKQLECRTVQPCHSRHCRRKSVNSFEN